MSYQLPAVSPARKAQARASAGRRVGVLGTGAGIPSALLTNADFERMVDTSDDWIVSRTGMHERRVVAAGESASSLALAAARNALESGGMAGEDLDLIVVATVSSDRACPTTACVLQNELGATRAAGFDLAAACSGFVYGLMTAHRLVAAGGFDNALVIGVEVLSGVTDYTDRGSCVLFGDGAGGVLLGAEPEHGEVIDHVVGADGSGGEFITVPSARTRLPAGSAGSGERRATDYLGIDGRKVFKFAVNKMCESVEELLTRNGMTVRDLDWLVPHQANLRILEAAAERLGIARDRVLVNIERYGNTSSASVPIVLDEAVRDGRIRRGQTAALVAFGGGLTWGASLLRW